MISDKHVPEAVVDRSRALQTRVLAGPPLLTAMSPQRLFTTMRTHLTKAAEDGRLKTSFANVMAQLRLAPQGEEFTIYGARLESANFKRSRAEPHFLRQDGAWFDFMVTGRGTAGRGLEILAYSCEIRFPDELLTFPRFVRFDLNPPGHANESAAMRCHMHPGHNDLQVVAPFIGPLEILDLCIHGLTWPAKQRSI